MIELLKATNSSGDLVVALAKKFNFKDCGYSDFETWEKVQKISFNIYSWHRLGINLLENNKEK